jgi:NADPH:quinone reductase-like Zn-dependent oxidoreductase
MRAAVLHRFGGTDALELHDDWPDPHVGPGDALVEVHACSVGRALDVEARGRGGDFHVRLPRILGSDPAGVVRAVGSAVRDLRPGDRVVSTSSLFCGRCEWCRRGDTHACEDHGALGIQRDGGDAELCAVPAGTLAPVPDHVSFVQAAAMGVAYPVSWNLLRHAGRLDAGQDVLVMGAAGGLGIAGVLIARALGAHPIAAVGSPQRMRQCRELLGVQDVVSYADAGWGERVRGLSRDGRGVDVVFENISDPATFDDALSTLRTGGHLVTCGSHGGGTVPLCSQRLYRGNLTVAGRTGASVAMTREVFALVAEGRLQPPPVPHVFPLEEIAAAHEAAAGRGLFNRAVLQIRPEVPPSGAAARIRRAARPRP